jgi:nucleotide-binding universal stress UspA family protein
MTTDQRAPERIMVGIDGSLASRVAVRWALEHAQPGDTVHLVNATQSSPSAVRAGLADDDDEVSAEALLHRELARTELLPHRHDINITGEVLRGDPKRCLMDIAADAIVVGSAGHGVVSRTVLGSVCAHLARHADVPVIVIPDPRQRRRSGEPIHR